MRHVCRLPFLAVPVRSLGLLGEPRLMALFGLRVPVRGLAFVRRPFAAEARLFRVFLRFGVVLGLFKGWKSRFCCWTMIWGVMA